MLLGLRLEDSEEISVCTDRHVSRWRRSPGKCTVKKDGAGKTSFRSDDTLATIVMAIAGGLADADPSSNTDLIDIVVGDELTPCSSSDPSTIGSRVEHAGGMLEQHPPR